MASDQELASSADPRALEPDDDSFELNDIIWDDDDDTCYDCGESNENCQCDWDEDDWGD